MSGAQHSASPSQPHFHHASVQEYRIFVDGYTESVKYRQRLLAYRAQFVSRYPDLQAWFKAPLIERVGRKHGEKRDQVSFPINYDARPYLKFLALYGYMQLDWDWIIAIDHLLLDHLLDYGKGGAGLQQLVEEAVELGYSRVSVKDYLQQVTDRIFLYTAQPHVDALCESALDELEEALTRFGERDDVALFYGSTERYQMLLQRRLKALYTMRVVLYHRGQVPTEPRMTRRQPRPARPVLKPRMEAP